MSEWITIPGYPGYEATADGVVRSKERERKNIRFSPTINRQVKTMIPAKIMRYDDKGKISLKHNGFTKRLKRDDVIGLIASAS